VEIEWSGFSQVQGGAYPRRIAWRDLLAHQSLVFDFDGTRLNADLENNRFEPNPHSDWKVIPWTSWQDMFGP
jgi:hypothetical protein